MENKAFLSGGGVTDSAACEITDKITEEGIRSALSELSEMRERRVALDVRQSVGSTNDIARQIALRGGPDADIYAVIAEEQSAGRGTRGRGFYSPPGGGIYMSLLCRTECAVSELPPVTPAAAVAVCRAIDSLYGLFGISRDVRIKWVNDIYIGGKKVCGILTESGVDGGVCRYVVIGIGINVYPPKGGFPQELLGRAGSVLDAVQDSARCRLAASVICNMLLLLRDPADRSFMDEYRARCMTLGQYVTFSRDGREVRVLAQAIGDRGELIGADGEVYT